MSNFIISYIAGLTAIIAIDLLTAALPLRLFDVFQNNFDVGLIFGSFPVVAIFFRAKISNFFFRMPLKKGLLINLVLMAASHAAYSFSVSRASFIAARSLFGVGLCGFYILLLEYINHEIEGSSHQKYYGIFSTLFIVSMLFAPAMGVEILRKYGFAALILSSLFAYAVSASAVFFIRDSRMKPPNFTSKKFYGYFISKRSHFVLLFFIIFAYSSAVVFLPRLAGAPLAEGGRALKDFAFAYSFISASTILVRILAGSLFEKLSMKVCILIGCVVLGGAMVGLRFSETYVALFSSAAFFGIGWAFFESNYIPSLLYGSADKSELITAYSLIFDSAWFLGPLVGGAISGFFGAQNLYLILPLCCIFAAVYFLKFNP